MPWTPELIHRIKKYVEANRRYRVYYQGGRVYGIDIPPDKYPIEQTAIYTQEYDDCPPDSFSTIEETEPEEFEVFSLAPVAWQDREP